MQTKQRIQELLCSAGTRPQKHLGQNFLIDLNLMRLLVETAQIGAEDVVLEVGAGTGSLSEALADRAGHLVTVEYDRHLAPIVRAQLAQHSHVDVLNTDVLANKHTFAPDVRNALAMAREKQPGRLLLVANLPYQVACPVISNLIVQAPIADAMVVTVQKEVADRLTATPDSNHYGPLSVLLAATGQARRIRVLKPTVFWPAPQVDSAMVRFDRIPERAARIADMDLFVVCLDFFMQHRRKMLRGALKSTAPGRLDCDWDDVFTTTGILPSLRPECVTPDQFVALANAIHAQGAC